MHIRLITLICVSIFTNLFCMEINNIAFSAPYFDFKKKEYVIEATHQNKQKIGSVAYFPIGGTQWQMRELYVDYDYRKKGIARTLLQECINQIKKLNAQELSWQIYPKDIGINEEQLVTIYFKMLNKIDLKHATNTRLEYRGSEHWHTPWMILTLE